MALNWNWNERIGYAILKNYLGEELLYTLYIGNAELIALYESKNQWCMGFFFVDKQHAINMLKDESFTETIQYFSFEKGTKKAHKIAKLLTDYEINVLWQEGASTVKTKEGNLNA